MIFSSFAAVVIVALSLVPRPVRAIRVTRGGLEPSAIARGLAKNGKKVPDRREKVPDNFSTKILCFLRTITEYFGLMRLIHLFRASLDRFN